MGPGGQEVWDCIWFGARTKRLSPRSLRPSQASMRAHTGLELRIWGPFRCTRLFLGTLPGLRAGG